MEANLDRTRFTSLMRRAPRSYWVVCILLPILTIPCGIYLSDVTTALFTFVVSGACFSWIFLSGGFEEEGTRPKGIDETRILLGFLGQRRIPLLGRFMRPRPVTIAPEDLRDGIAIHGARGSGRTSLVTSICGEVAMLGGGALILANDEFAFPDTYHEILERMAEHGREDDVFLLDFGGTARRCTTIDPLEDLTDVDIAVCLTNAARRANAMDDVTATRITSLLMAAIPMARTLSANASVGLYGIAYCISFVRLVHVADTDLAELDVETRQRLMQPVIECMRTIPGFEWGRGLSQSAKVMAEIDRVENLIHPALTTMAGFRNVLVSQAADLSMRDVVLGKRIVLVRLPSDDASRAMIVELLSGVLGRILDMQGPRLGSPFVLFDDESGIDWSSAKAMLDRHGRSGFGFVGAPASPPDKENEPGISIHMRSNGDHDVPKGVDRTALRDQRTGDFVLVDGNGVRHCTALHVHPSRRRGIVPAEVTDMVLVEKDLVP